MTLQSQASRIKKDLFESKEAEIISLLDQKLETLDTLIAEAKVYKSETDPLIQDSFFNLLRE